MQISGYAGPIVVTGVRGNPEFRIANPSTESWTYSAGEQVITISKPASGGGSGAPTGTTPATPTTAPIVPPTSSSAPSPAAPPAGGPVDPTNLLAVYNTAQDRLRTYFANPPQTTDDWGSFNHRALTAVLPHVGMQYLMLVSAIVAIPGARKRKDNRFGIWRLVIVLALLTYFAVAIATSPAA
jgi:hypothetical protein